MSVRRDLAFRPEHPTRPSSRNYPLNDNLTPGENPRRPTFSRAPLRRGRRSLKRGRCGPRSVAGPSLWLVVPRWGHPRQRRRSSLSSGCATSGRTSQGRSSSLPRRAGARPRNGLEVLDARSAGWMRSSELEQHVDKRAGFEVIAVKPLVKQLASMLIGGTLSRRSRCRRSLASSSATSAIWSSPCTSAEELKNLR